MIYHYRVSAKLAGHRVHLVDSSRFTYDFGAFQGLEHLLEVDDAIEQAAVCKPDLVVLDGNYIPKDFGLTRERVDRLRAMTRACLVATVADNYGETGLCKCEYWTSVRDLVLSFEPSAEHPAEIQNKIQLMFIPIELPALDIPRSPGRVYYSGSARGDRIAYLAMMLDQKIPLTAAVTSRNAASSIEYDHYLRKVAAHGMALNSGRRTVVRIGDDAPENIITGRAHEVIKLGTLLLQRSGSRLSEFFNPGTHYVEFRDVDDLRTKIHYFGKNEDERERVTSTGQAFALEYYKGENFWNLVFDALNR